jgi:hypothetical protein
MGGFHLAQQKEDYVREAVMALKAIEPDYVILMHCTGEAFYEIAERELPKTTSPRLYRHPLRIQRLIAAAARFAHELVIRIGIQPCDRVFTDVGACADCRPTPKGSKERCAFGRSRPRPSAP